MKFKRILLKVSGERLAGEQHDTVLDVHAIEEIAAEIKTLVEKKVEVGVVIGGGEHCARAGICGGGNCGGTGTPDGDVGDGD